MSGTEAKRKKEIDEDEIEIRLSDVLKFLKDSRRSVIRWMTIFFSMGILYALSQKDEFTATVKVMPELKTPASGAGGLSDLKSLAGLAGVNLNSLSGTSEAIRPDLYPDIVQSVPFSLYLLPQQVRTASVQLPQTFEAYLIQENNEGFVTRLRNMLNRGDDDKRNVLIPLGSTIQLTPHQEALSKTIHERVSIVMDKKSGVLTITVQMNDPVVAAIVADQTLDYLTTYVTSYRTGKARKQVQFLSQQVNNARQKYESAELQLSSYRDRNRSLFLNTAKIEEQRLQADYILTQGVYSDLSKQLEQARIKEQEEAPVFQILEPPQVPLHKSGPKRTLLIIGFAILGVLVGLIVFFLRRFTFDNINK